MEINFRHIVLVSLLVFVSFASSYGQWLPERRMARQGNRDYAKEKYDAAETDYRRALERAPWSYEGAFGLGNSLYKQGRYEEAAAAYGVLADDTVRLKDFDKSNFNLGNALFQQGQYDKALEAYRRALLVNPDDREAKFNYAYAKKMLENQDGGGGGGGDDQQDQNQGEQPEQGDGQQNQNQDEQPEQGDGQQNQDQGEQPQPTDPDPSEGGINKKDAEMMLEAMQMREDKTQEKVNEKKGKAVVGRSGKNW